MHLTPRHSLVSRILTAVDQEYLPYLIASSDLLAKGVVKEASDREYPSPILTLAAYMDARRESIGARPFLDLGRWNKNISIPSDVITHPTISKLEEQAIDMASLANVGLSACFDFSQRDLTG